jgi:hypothetical protein
MTTQSSDISVVLSGGSANLDPNKSLGGQPSSSPIVNNSLNNLFDDISPDEADVGHEDYRCIYIFNDGDTSVFEVALWISSDYTGGATMELGVEQASEMQRITVAGSPTGGSLLLSYDSREFTVFYHSDLADWAKELQTKLNALTNDQGGKLLGGVSVTTQNTGAVTIFDINFIGRDASRNHSTITVVANSLTPNSTITIATTRQGGPINTSAVGIDVETTPPGGVSFFAASEASPISFPRLDPGDGFPLWVKRTILAETDPVERDGFQLRFAAQTLEPA